MFRISPQTIYNWLGRNDLKPTLARQRHRKIDKDALRRHVRQFPFMLLRERAKIFGISVPGLSIALRTMNIVKKTKSGMWSEII